MELFLKKCRPVYTTDLSSLWEGTKRNARVPPMTGKDICPAKPELTSRQLVGPGQLGERCVT